MQTKEQFYTRVQDSFCTDGFYYEDLCVEIPSGMFKTVKRDFDLIVFNNKAIILFISLPAGIAQKDVVLALRSALNCMVNKLSISVQKFVVCGANEEQYFFFNNFNDRLHVFGRSLEDGDELLALIDATLYFLPDFFDYDSLRAIEDKLVFSSSVKLNSDESSKVKTAADGTVYVKKHGTWKEASDVDSNHLFVLAALTGMLGGHLFYLKKTANGILYLLTFGFFGVGWFFDSIEIMLGVYKDPDGKYLLPIHNKVAGLLWLALGAVGFYLLFIILSFFFKLLLGLF